MPPASRLGDPRRPAMARYACASSRRGHMRARQVVDGTGMIRRRPMAAWRSPCDIVLDRDAARWHSSRPACDTILCASRSAVRSLHDRRSACGSFGSAAASTCARRSRPVPRSSDRTPASGFRERADQIGVDLRTPARREHRGQSSRRRRLDRRRHPAISGATRSPSRRRRAHRRRSGDDDRTLAEGSSTCSRSAAASTLRRWPKRVGCERRGVARRRSPEAIGRGATMARPRAFEGSQSGRQRLATEFADAGLDRRREPGARAARRRSRRAISASSR